MGFLVENIHLVERRDVGHGLFTAPLWQGGRPRRAGNIYYQDKKDAARRWVIYAGDNDGSRVPPDWHAVAARDDRRTARQRRCRRCASSRQAPTPNLTGTMAAFRPDGALGWGRSGPPSTGDYEPWMPE